MSALSDYTPSNSEKSAGGTVTVVTAGVGLYVDANLAGVTAACYTQRTVSGAVCGLHIHSGTSCADSSSVGGHYDAESVTATAGTLPKGTTKDPWGGSPT